MVKQPDSGFVRMPYVRPCRVDVGGRSSEAFLCNVSEVGVFVAMDSPPEVGREGHLVFELGDDGPAVEAAVQVAWQNRAAGSRKAYALPQGCGLRFTALGAGDRDRIRKMVEQFESALRGEGTVLACASCGRVYLGGAWQRRDRLKAQLRVSHGVCPECAARLYPDLFQKVRDRRKKG